MWIITQAAAFSDRFSHARLGCGLVLLVPLILMLIAVC